MRYFDSGLLLKLAHHLTDFFDLITLRGDRVARSSRYKTAFLFVLAHFENDLAPG